MYPVFSGRVLHVVSLATSPLLKAPAMFRAGDRLFPVDDGPPFELAGLQIWNKAEELAGLGRELSASLAWPEGEGSYRELAPLLADERHARAPLRFLSRFRPPLEQECPEVLMGATLQGAGHAPMDLSEEELALLADWLEARPAVGLFSGRDAAFFRERGRRPPAGRRRRRQAAGGAPGADATPGRSSLSGWRAAALLKERGKGPYPPEKSVVELPGESWMMRTAELFGMLPLKWASSGGFFQGAPASASWGDVLRAAAPSLGVRGPADALFPVPVLSGSLLDNAVGPNRAEVFAVEGRPVPSRHVMICGPTGTGKTLLGTFAMLNECVERGSPAVYLGPTRMLVEDAALEFLRLLGAVEREAGGAEAVDRREVLVSTGESFYDDGRIAAGDFKAAFIVYEKAGNFFLNSDLTDSLGFALIDELHMLGDRIRGGALDATLTRLVIEARARIRAGREPLRLMCLSTGAMAGDHCLLEMMCPPGQERFPWPDGARGDARPGPAGDRPGRGPGRGAHAGAAAVAEKGAAGTAEGEGGIADAAPRPGRIGADAPGATPPGGPVPERPVSGGAVSGARAPGVSDTGGTANGFRAMAAPREPVRLELYAPATPDVPDAPDAREALDQGPSADPSERLSPGFLHNPRNPPVPASVTAQPDPPLPSAGGPPISWGHGPPAALSDRGAAGPPIAGTPREAIRPSGFVVAAPGLLAEYPGLRRPEISPAGRDDDGASGGPASFGTPHEGGPVSGPGAAGPADSVYEAARRPEFQAPTGWGPLVLSVFERPQRLMTFIQPTSPGARCRPFHVGRIADSQLTPADFVLDREGGARFIATLDGWIPGHEKIIYASYSGISLTAFARRAVEDFGRGRVPDVVEDGFYLRELEASLAKSGTRERSARFYLEAAARGVFFHFSGLSRETRRLMADGYRRFAPLPCEPLILCATETISYGVNLPADALFLENISWPRSRYRHSYSIEALTANEFRNLVGRVGRYGHIKPGVIPTVLVNWPLGKSVNSPALFEGRRKVLAEIASSSPASEIDCRDLQAHLARPAAARLSDYPGPVGRFYLLSILHASKASGGGPVTAEEAAAFLSETYTVRSLERSAAPPRRGWLVSGLSGFLEHLVREFGNLVVEEVRGEGRRRYLPGGLCANLARNDTSPYTLKELDGLIAALASGPGAPLGRAGLMALVAAPLLTEMRHVFTRVFSDPRMLSQGALKKARTDREEAERWFRWAAEPAERLLAGEGLTPEEARGICERVRSEGRSILERHLRENFRNSSRVKEVVACLRDAYLQKVLSTIKTLLMWIDGRAVKSILSVAGSGLRAASPGSGEDGEGVQEGREVAEAANAGVKAAGKPGMGGGEGQEGPEARETEDPARPEDSQGGLGGGRGTSGGGAGLGGEAGLVAGDGPDAGEGLGAESGQDVWDDPDADAGRESEDGLDAAAGIAPESVEAREGKTPARRLKGGVDTHSFNQRYCDKTALVIDSYLAYRLAAGRATPEEASSLQLMGDRARWGLRGEDLEAFNRNRKESGMGREEWLALVRRPDGEDG
jgi:hypothetical protein